jgi:hypothetical protein
MDYSFHDESIDSTAFPSGSDRYGGMRNTSTDMTPQGLSSQQPILAAARGAFLSSLAGSELLKVQASTRAASSFDPRTAVHNWKATAELLEAVEGPMQYTCGACGKAFASSYKLRQHQNDSTYCREGGEINGPVPPDVMCKKPHKTKRGGKRVQEQKAKKRALIL